MSYHMLKHLRSQGHCEPRLTVPQILKWADDFHHRTGLWPNTTSGRIHSTKVTWRGINQSLLRGNPGLSPGSSLKDLLSQHRSTRNYGSPPKLIRRVIIRWAKSHFQRTGKWPSRTAGHVEETPDETWGAIHSALRAGRRGLPSGSSLPLFLAMHGLKRHRQRPPSLTLPQILNWADEFHARHGR